MILHKYVKYSYGIDIINRLRIKVSSPKDFNDPFEFLPKVTDLSPEQIDAVLSNGEYLQNLYNYGIKSGKINKPYKLFMEEQNSPIGRAKLSEKMVILADVLRRACKEMQKESGDIALMTCFCEGSSDNPDEILMWSHYADAHKGLRIAFDSKVLDSQDVSFIKVEYAPDRIELNPLTYWKGGHQQSILIFDKIISTKSSIWSYEKEYRWLLKPKSCQKKWKHSFYPINPKAIMEIVCGVECTSKQISAIKKLSRAKFSSDVKIKKAEIDDHKFKLNYIEC